jgi:hypothetical protein
MQGRYGSKWIDLWRTGETDEQGYDTGMSNAMQMWAQDLSGFADKPQCIQYALDAMSANPFPPTLPEFREVCRDHARRSANESPKKLGYKMTEEDREKQAEMASYVAAAVKSMPKRDEDSAGLFWATNPRSQFAASQVCLEAADGNAAMRRIKGELVAQGILSSDGKLLKKWDGTQFIPA